MKAKEYFAKYDERITAQSTTNETDAVADLLIELCGETKELVTKRNARRPQAVIAVIKEFNGKWNAIAILFERKYGLSPLKENGFSAFWANEMPELAPFLNKTR